MLVSDVIDEPNGSPMLLYHGTKTPEKLELVSHGSGERGEMLGPGIYFSNSPIYASFFGQPIPFYVSAKNLLKEDDPAAVATWEKNGRIGYFAQFQNKYARQHGYDGIIGKLGSFGGIRAFQIVVFSPEQVRPVTNKNPHYIT